MGALSKKELALKRKELLKDGIAEVIDAQNASEYLLRKKGVLKEEKSKEKIVLRMESASGDDFSDDVLKRLSSSPEDQLRLMAQLQMGNKKKQTSIRDIDWKNVKTF